MEQFEEKPIYQSQKLYTTVKHLFEKPYTNVQELIKLLHENQMTRYLTLKEFNLYLSRIFKYEEFQRLFKADFLRHNKMSKGTPYHFPIIKYRGNKLFQKFQVEEFMKQYVKESKKQVPRQTVDEQIDKEEFYELHDGKYLMEQAKKYSNFSSPETDKTTSQHQNVQSVQQVETQERFDQKQTAIVPTFFIYKSDGTERLSVKYLLSIETTQIFMQQLKQVKKLIEDQIDNNKFIFKTFCQFFKQYTQYYEISTSQKSNDNNDLKFIQYYQKIYIAPNNKAVYFQQGEGHLLKCWNQIHQNAQKDSENKIKSVSNKMKQTLKQSLQNICLCFILKDVGFMEYAFSDQKLMKINMNMGNQDLCRFKKLQLRPYMYICIYHQMAHDLIRKLGQFKIQPDISFTLDKNTFGCKVLKIIRNNYPIIRQFLHSKMIRQFHTVDQKISEIKVIIKNVINFLSQHNGVINKIKRHNYLLLEIVSKIKAIKFVKQFVYTMSQPEVMSQALEQIQHYLQGYESSISKDQNVQMQQELQFEYRFIFSLVAYKLFNAYIDHPLQKNYRPYQQYIQKVRLLKRFYFGQRQGINQLLKHIKSENKTFFHQPEVKTFQDLLLSVQTPFQIISKLIKQFLSFFNKQEVMVYISKGHQLIDKHPFQVEKDTYSYFKKHQYEQLELQLNRIVSIKQSSNIFMKFLKYSELYIIGCMTPGFFFSNAELQSGFQIQSKLFPTMVQTKTLYPIDYQQMKSITSANRKLIGAQKKDNILKQRPFKVGRTHFNNHAGLDLKDRVCMRGRRDKKGKIEK